MNKDELELYIKKAYENVFKKLAENPEEMLNLSDLQDKYNNLLKEKIELKEQIKKQKEIINKAIEYIQGHQLVFRDHTTEEIDEWFNQFYIDVLDILKGGGINE